MNDETDGRKAEVLQLPVRGGTVEQLANTPAEIGDSEPELHDTSFEVVLDDEPAPAPIVSTVDKTPVLQPVIPEHLRTKDGRRSTVKRIAQRSSHKARYHSVRLPMYLFWCVVWGIVGLAKGIWVQLRWWWLAEVNSLKRDAKEKNDHPVYMGYHKEERKTRYARGRWILAEVVSMAIGGIALWFLAPWWSWLILAAVVLPILARFGRPADKPIVSTAVIQPRFRVITGDAVLRAYYAAGLGDPEKPDQQIHFEGFMSRDSRDIGSQVRVVLPYGGTYSQATKSREKIASGLDVALTQVYLTRDKTSNRRHLLWIGDVDPLSILAGKTNLLDCKPRDIWTGVPFGLDEQGLRVTLPLIFQSILIAAQPRKGKTFTARLIALFAALDPYVRISVFDGAGKPDLRGFALVAHTYGFGLLPDRVQGNPIENLLATLRAVKKEILQRNVALSELPTSVCPEGKLTRDIARNKRYRMPVWVILLDEFQEFLKTGDEAIDLEIADLLVFMVRVGPSAGIIPISSTQRPVGLGSSTKIGKLFADYRDNHLIRFALKTGTSKVSDYILGEGAAAEGFDSSDLPVGDEFRGIGILYDAPVDNCTARTFLADGEDAERILIAARKLRERAGTLDGMATGESIPVQPRDPLADTLDVFLPGESEAAWNDLAARLVEQLPEQYADTTGGALGATLRGLKLGIDDVSVRVSPSEAVPSGVTKGPKRAALERAMARREREEANP